MPSCHSINGIVHEYDDNILSSVGCMNRFSCTYSRQIAVSLVSEVTGLGLKEAKEAVDNAPKVLKEQASKEDAEAIKAKLEEVKKKKEILKIWMI